MIHKSVLSLHCSECPHHVTRRKLFKDGNKASVVPLQGLTIEKMSKRTSHA